MKITRLKIKNYRSFNNNGIDLSLKNLLGLVGANSAGKSNILRALDLFFNSSKVAKEDFYDGNTENRILIDVSFTLDEADYETDELIAKLLVKDNVLTLRKEYSFENGKSNEGSIKPVGIWKSLIEDDVLDPYSETKTTPLKQFVKEKNEAYKQMSDYHGANLPDKADEFNEIKRRFWLNCVSDNITRSKMLKWQLSEELSDLPASVKYFVKNLNLPEYVYVPVEYSIDEALAVRKGSFLDILFQSLFVNEDSQSTKTANELQNLADKYYFHKYGKEIRKLNDQLLSPEFSWNFSGASMNIEHEEYDIQTLLKPKWKLMINDGFMSNAKSKGNGIQRLALFQMLQLYVSGRKRKKANVILAIEEPELYLHPSYKRAMYRLFRNLQKSIQVFYSTHEPCFVKMEYFDEIAIVRKSNTGNTIVCQSDFSIFDKNELFKEVFGRKKTEESRRNDLQNKCGEEQSNGFFADKIIIVEGNTEIYALPIYFSKFDFNIDERNIAIVRANSVGIIKTLYAIFNAFRIPIYVIFDGDKPKGNDYNKFLNMKSMNQQSLKEFCLKYKKYIDNPDQLSDLIACKKPTSLNKELVEEIKSSNPEPSKIRSLFEESYLEYDKYKDYSDKLGRNKGLLSILQYDGPVDAFLGTISRPMFTKWEYNFEESINKHITDYTEVEAAAKSAGIDGKPLIAKYIADHVSVKKMDDSLKAMFNDLIVAIRDLNEIPDFSVKKETNKEILMIQMVENKTTESYPLLHLSSEINTIESVIQNPAISDVYVAGEKIPEDTSWILHIDRASQIKDIPLQGYVAIKSNYVIKSGQLYVIKDGTGIKIRQYLIDRKTKKIKLISQNKDENAILYDGGIEVLGMVICDKHKKPMIFEIV